jgi:hypothetical protein
MHSTIERIEGEDRKARYVEETRDWMEASSAIACTLEMAISDCRYGTVKLYLAIG